MAELTHSRALDALDYNTETGVLTRRDGRAIGGIQKSTGYHRATLDGVVYLSHRLIWFWVHGVWPTSVIDHVDGNPANNVLSNLRDVSRKANTQNQRHAHKNSKSGVLGAHPFRGKYTSAIKVNGRLKHLGVFATAEDAHAAYIAAKRIFHEGYVA